MDIHARVLNDRALDELRWARDLDGLAEKLNLNPPYERHQRFITARAIVTLHKVEGREILRRLQAMAEDDIGMKFMLPFLTQGEGLDIGDPDMWENLDDLAAAYQATAGAKGLSEAHCAMLKSLALRPVYVDRLQVAKALFNDDATEK